MAKPKLLDHYRGRLRVKHYSLRTEDAYLHWARRLIFHANARSMEQGFHLVGMGWHLSAIAPSTA
jgi:hypothetical protein